MLHCFVERDQSMKKLSAFRVSSVQEISYMCENDDNLIN